MKTDISGSENEFYRMCLEDNQIIFELTQDEIKIPHIQLSQLSDIIFKRLKLNKACDIFKLTVEHLRNCGEKTLRLFVLTPVKHSCGNHCV